MSFDDGTRCEVKNQPRDGMVKPDLQYLKVVIHDNNLNSRMRCVGRSKEWEIFRSFRFQYCSLHPTMASRFAEAISSNSIGSRAYILSAFQDVDDVVENEATDSASADTSRGV